MSETSIEWTATVNADGSVTPGKDLDPAEWPADLRVRQFPASSPTGEPKEP